jgi:hypothetical protein
MICFEINGNAPLENEVRAGYLIRSVGLLHQDAQV